MNMRRGGLGRPMYRKNSLRLKTWDYFSPGPYFFTICAHDRREILDNQIFREKVIEAFKNIAAEFYINIHALVVGTDHVHGLVTLSNDRKINLYQYIGKVKVKITQTISGKANGWASPPLRKKIWQRSFYDHIIRDEKDFMEKAQYIENHPLKEEGTLSSEWH